LQNAFFEEGFDSPPLWPVRFHEGDDSIVKTVAAAAAVTVGFGLLCVASRLLAQNDQHTSIFWAANGVLTAFLLRRSPKRWPVLLVAACLGDIAASSWLGIPPLIAIGIALCNVFEALVAASLMRRVVRREPDLAAPGTMVRFVLFACSLAPALSGVLASLCYRLAIGVTFLHLLSRWFPSHALGMIVMAPLILAWSGSDLRGIFRGDRAYRSAAVLALTLAASIAVFAQTHHSLRFICVPLLMLVVFEAGVLGAVAAIFEISIVATLYTLHGHGPLWMEKGATMQGNILDLQIAMFVLAVSVVPFAAILDRQRQLHRILQYGIERYRLLADNSRDIVVLSNLDGRRLYVSPAVQDALGWTREEWTGRDSAELMHPSDIPAFRRLLKEILRGNDRRTFRYRTRHKDGRYLWMEANVRTLPDAISGEPNAFVANVRDISLRVDAEQKLAEAHQQVQEQAQRDSLTELANRRRFDEILDKEWRRGRRTGSPLALLMVDIDNFKRINDTFGHRAGDACLKTLAGVLCQVTRRPGDVAARYGGDEFAVLLPDVDSKSAAMIADNICLKVRQQLFQAGVGRSLALTVSVGFASHIPQQTTRADQLVESADRALYAAKQNGRDRAATRHEVAVASSRTLHPVK
jgi:diguanylate cyclase (GGDEF)-like protein/PAS domain S-box-containing protein